MTPCPACEGTGAARTGPGDLVTCPDCGVPFWAPDGADRGRPVAPPEKKPPSAAAIFGLHAGVLLAEGVLAAAVVGALAGLPLFAFGRASGWW